MTESEHQATAYVVMGVCGVGKTKIGKGLAANLGASYIEADDFHPAENIDAMQRGIPLTDEMRRPWLVGLSHAVEDARQQGTVVVACSALKKSYRDLIRGLVGKVQFVFLTGEQALIAERLAARTDHFMPPQMLQSQLDTLEEPAPDEEAFHIDVKGSSEVVLARVLRKIVAASHSK